LGLFFNLVLEMIGLQKWEWIVHRLKALRFAGAETIGHIHPGQPHPTSAPSSRYSVAWLQQSVGIPKSKGKIITVNERQVQHTNH
jgi:hypothetical protein